MKRLSSSYRLIAILLATSIAALAHCQLNTWVYKAHMSAPRASFAAVTGADGRIYVFGGRLGTGPDATKSSEAYDPTTDSWSPIADLPEAMADEPAVLMPNGQIVIVSDAGSNNIYDYDPSTNTYATLGTFDTSVMGPPRRGVPGPNGKVYFDGFFSEVIGTYDFSTNSWTASKTLHNILQRAGFLSVGDTSYVIGGEDGGPALKSLDSYNWHTDVEQNLADLPAGRYELGCTIGNDGRFYALGGVDTNSTNEADAYDPATNAWSTLAPMQMDRAYFVSVTGADGRIYALGGYTGIGTLSSGLTDTVESYQPALLTSSSATITVTEGNPFNGTVALLKDLNTSQLASNFTATVDWGDGSAIDTASVVDNGGNGNFKVTGGHTYAKAGPYSATVSMTDSDGETASASDAVTVNDATVTLGSAAITAQSGIAFSGLVGTLADANPLAQASDFTGTIDWGDGTTTVATIVLESGGSKFDIDGTHTYTTAGAYPVHIKIVEGSFQFLIHESANVVAPSAVVSAGHITAVEGANFNGQVATFIDADPNQGLLNFTATIDWGDGVTSGGTVASDGSGGFIVSGNHTYAEEGSYAVTVTVAVTGGLSSSSTGSANVTDAPITASSFNLICKGTNFSNTVAAFTDADLLGTTSDYAASIFWGDGKSSNGTIVAAGSGWKVVGSHAYLKRGKYTVTITIRDMGGATAAATTHINVGPVK